MSAQPFVIELGAESKLARYWRVSAGKSGGAMVTVREGERATICLTCTSERRCSHVRAVEDHVAATKQSASAAA